MKKVILSVAVIIAMGLTSCKNETKKVEETQQQKCQKKLQ